MTERDWRPWQPGTKGRLDGLAPVIGHRGAAAHAPENTLASIRRAHALGCRWVEIDVKLSADGVPFLLHDDLLDRTTNGSGPAASMGWEALCRLDAGSWQRSGHDGEPLASLAQAIALITELGLELNLEIKPCPGREVETALAITRALAELWPASRSLPLLSSFEIPSLRAAKDAAPHMPRALLVEGVPQDWRRSMADLGCVSLNISHRQNGDGEIAGLVDEGVPLLAYTVNDPARARRLLAIGVQAVFSDVPDRILVAIGTDGEGR